MIRRGPKNRVGRPFIRSSDLLSAVPPSLRSTLHCTTVVKVSPSQSTDIAAGGGTEENDLILEGNCPLYRMDREEEKKGV